MPTKTLFASQLKYWRQVQGISQLSLATLASTTTRHISFLENGRSRPSGQMVIRLTEALEVPVRERNQLLKAAGYEGNYPEEEWGCETSTRFMKAIRYSLEAHAPFPAFVRNRYHEIVDLNEPARRLFSMLEPNGLQTNLIEWILAPQSNAQHVFENFEAVAWGMVYRLRGEAAVAPHDKKLQELAHHAELRSKNMQSAIPTKERVMCPVLLLEGQRISLMTLEAKFGSAQDAGLDELRVEMMHPRDDVTESFFRDLAKTPPLRLAR